MRVRSLMPTTANRSHRWILACARNGSVISTNALRLHMPQRRSTHLPCVARLRLSVPCEGCIVHTCQVVCVTIHLDSLRGLPFDMWNSLRVSRSRASSSARRVCMISWGTASGAFAICSTPAEASNFSLRERAQAANLLGDRRSTDAQVSSPPSGKCCWLGILEHSHLG